VDPKQGEHSSAPSQSVWPVGVAAGVACVLVGLIISWWVVAIGGGVTLVFGFLWLYELSGHRLRLPAPPPAPPKPGPSASAVRRLEGPSTTRQGFLSGATLGLGAVIGGAVTVPPVFLAIVPPFLKQGHKDVDVGPISDFPQGEWRIATFLLDPSQGEVSRRTAYIRYNGLLGRQPSFTIISNRCAHLGCPVQPLGLVQDAQKKEIRTSHGEVVDLIPVLAVSGFSCPCHGGAYDEEGNRTAGPPVRGLDRYEFSIRNGHLFIGRNYSVSHVDDTGANAKIHKYDLTGPGQHVDGWEQIFYPVQPPH